MMAKRKSWLEDYVGPEEKGSYRAAAILFASALGQMALMSIVVNVLAMLLYIIVSGVVTIWLALRIKSPNHPINNWAGSILVGVACGWWLWLPMAIVMIARKRKARHGR